MDERNDQIKQGVVEGVEVIQSGAAAGHEVMQVFASSVARRVPDVRIEELHSMVTAMLEEVQRNYERANKTNEYSMKFAEPNRSNEKYSNAGGLSHAGGRKTLQHECERGARARSAKGALRKMVSMLKDSTFAMQGFIASVQKIGH
jgi:hypothetical protein